MCRTETMRTGEGMGLWRIDAGVKGTAVRLVGPGVTKINTSLNLFSNNPHDVPC